MADIRDDVRKALGRREAGWPLSWEKSSRVLEWLRLLLAGWDAAEQREEAARREGFRAGVNYGLPCKASPISDADVDAAVACYRGALNVGKEQERG